MYMYIYMRVCTCIYMRVCTCMCVYIYISSRVAIGRQRAVFCTITAFGVTMKGDADNFLWLEGAAG